MERFHMRAFVALAILLGLVGCSSSTQSATSSKTVSASVTPTAKETDVIAAKCPTEKAGHASLPAGFPKLAGVTFNESKQAGPSTIVSGYTATDMDALDVTVKAAFSTGGFRLTHSEKDVHDAEIDFAGKKTTGQVKLKETCAGRTYITVTIRPA